MTTAWPKDDQGALIAFYGDPARDEVAAQLVHVTPPFKMFYEGQPVPQLLFHRKAAAALSTALSTIWDYYGRNQAKIDALGVSKTAGTYNKRPIRGSTRWSNHAFGAAIDINAEENGFNVEGNIPRPVIAAFKAQGARWGGEYHGRTDPMHFEFCDNGEPARTFDEWLAHYGVTPGRPISPAPAGRHTGITATVFGGSSDPNTSAYDGHRISDSELGVALPARITGTRPKVRVIHGDRSVVCSIVDVGPWNTDDPYWRTDARPQAETGTDRRGRHTNHAGIDLTPAAARAIGIDGKGVVDWEFVTSTGDQPVTDSQTVPPHFTIDFNAIEGFVETVAKFLPIASGFYPPLKAALPFIPILEEVLKMAGELQTSGGGAGDIAKIVSSHLHNAAGNIEQAFKILPAPAADSAAAKVQDLISQLAQHGVVVPLPSGQPQGAGG